ICATHKVQRFVDVSSTAALDTGADALPERSVAPGNASTAQRASAPNERDAIDDSLATDPKRESRPLYSRGKIATEQALSKLCKERGLALTIVRPGVVLGAGTPMQHSGLGFWPRDNHCIGWGDGEHPLPVVWVDD